MLKAADSWSLQRQVKRGKVKSIFQSTSSTVEVNLQFSVIMEYNLYGPCKC